MANLTVIDREGRERSGPATTGISVMEIIRDRGIDELVALCGGACSCATCHVYVDQQWRELLPPVSEDESDLLDSSDYRQAGSRLSCQIIFNDSLDGLTVMIAPEN